MRAEGLQAWQVGVKLELRVCWQVDFEGLVRRGQLGFRVRWRVDLLRTKARKRGKLEFRLHC